MAIENVEVPMAGKIIKVLVKAGDKVNAEDEICVFEAMKMNNSLYTTVTGTVKELRVVVGQPVKVGDIVALIEY